MLVLYIIFSKSLKCGVFSPVSPILVVPGLFAGILRCRKLQEASGFPGKGKIQIAIKLGKYTPLPREHLSRRFDGTAQRAQREYDIFQL